MSQFYTYPPSSSSSANASIGTNGSTAPGSSTEMGGIGADANLHALSVDNTGKLNVITTSSVLPTGASTSALQTSGNSSLTTIATNIPAQGQALAAASMPVVLPAAQITTLTPPTSVTVTQATGTNLHAVVDSGTITTVSTVTAVTAITNALPTGTNTIGSVKVTDGTNTSAVKAASTAAVAADPAVVVALSPNNNTLANALITKVSDGTNTAAVKAASTAPAATDPALVVSMSPNSGDPTYGTVTNGTAGTKSALVGGVFNTSLPTLTTGQQAAIQLDASGRQIMGTSAATIGSVKITDGTTIPVVQAASAQPSTADGALTVSLSPNQCKSPTATLSNVASSATNVTLLAANTSRKQATLFNDSTAICYVKFGATASTSSYTLQMAANSYYELPSYTYNGKIDGIWASANGNMRVTELT